MPLRPAGRHRHAAPAARRIAFPDDLLPHLSAGDGCIVDAGVRGLMARCPSGWSRTSSSPRRIGRRTSITWIVARRSQPPPASARCPRLRRSAPAECRAGEVLTRTGCACAGRRARGQSGRRCGAGGIDGARDVGHRDALCGTHGGCDRLRHQLHPDAHRVRGGSGLDGRDAPAHDRAAGEGLEQTGRISDAALSRAFAACDDYSAALRSADVGWCASWPPRRRGTLPTLPSSSTV